ncbi:MAG: TetR family transcriptional regulator [Chitinophagaceae bacterium]|nr:TetR family transcriptional regulator [Chitinophagaceae bacterium]MBL0055494.1 TetR family transcriptional regulator [Chitinophagaceae bacterium]
MSKIVTAKNTSKKDAIILRASGLFKNKGYNAASMRELAESLGVEAPSLYNHIGSKSELLQAICFKVAEEFTSQLHQAEISHKGSQATVEAIIRFHIRMMVEHYDEVFVANHEWKHLKEPYLSDFLNQRRTYEKKLVALVEKGITERVFRNINPYVVVLNLLSAVRGLEFWHRHKNKVDTQELEEDMVTHLLTGMVN